MRRASWLKGLTAALLALAVACNAVGVSQAAPSSPVIDTATATIQAAHFAEPLVRARATTTAEDQALAQALQTFQRRSTMEDMGALTTFLAQHPRSGWAAALWTDLGLSYLHDGHFSLAIEAFKAAWVEGKDAQDPQARAVVDRAVGELVHLYASFGQFDQVSALFTQIGSRPIIGSATESVQQAREELGLVTRDPIHLFNCGPVALKLLIQALDPRNQSGDFLQWYKAGAKGTNLAELGGLADKAKFSYRIVSRAPGQAVPYPAIVHWKVGHFATIDARANGRYHLQDPAFPGGLWVTEDALDAEASGYFLVPANAPNDAGWRTVGASEAARVWGKGPTSGVQAGDANDPGAHSKPPAGKPKKPGKNPGGGGGKNPPKSCPLCEYDIKLATVGVTLSDTPVGYDPPIGPSAAVTISYNQREDSQPAVFGFFNVSPKWTLDWLTYVTDDPTNPGATVSRYLPGGGAYYYSGYSSGTGRFAAQSDDGSYLVLSSQSPVTYRRQLSDGSIEVYDQSDGSTSYPRKIFLSQMIDPQGNSLSLTYDGQMRLTSLNDASGRQTTFSYNQPGQPLLVTRITDPFGRYATLSYDAFGRLASITDIIGLISSFTYDTNSLINSMTTPYGTTTFAYTAPGAGGPPRFVQVTDPLGYNERVEWVEPASAIPNSDPAATVPQGMTPSPVNNYLQYRDSFYWDKNAYILAGCTPSGGCDYTKAHDVHFLHVPNTSIKSTSIESVKDPLENRIWYTYPGQTTAIYEGVFSQPAATGRVLDDGSTQLSQVSYDASGYFLPTQMVDPVGRVASYSYANQIDLAAVSQTTANGVRTTIAQFTYNTHHRPVLATDAAGQTTSYAYNAAGQPTSTTNPLGQTTTFHYDAVGRLDLVTNANNATAATYTYDAYDRVATYTDSEGWMAAYTYDAADRITKVTYPDGTTDIYAYDKLDLASYQDRLGRKWTYAHDANRRLTATTDPSGHQTLYAYSGTNRLTSLTDPTGNVTAWIYDLQSRLTTKTYADASAITYVYEATTSRLKSATDALGQIKQYAYAKDDRLAGLTYASAVNPTPNVSFVYDRYFPRLSSRTDGSGTTQYSYVGVGSPGALSVLQESAPLASGTITYAYDALGRLASRTVAGSAAETFQYDAIGRLAGHTSDLGAFTLTYLGQTGQITQRSLTGSTLATSWSYLSNAGDRRLAQVASVGLTASQHSEFQYTTDAENFTTGMAQTSNSAISYPPGMLTQTASYNTLNQLTNLSGQALTYDANGNVLSDGNRTYSWDAENRLVGIAYPGQPGKATAFSYDGLGRRTTISSTPTGGGGTTTTSYLWCSADICQARNTSGAVTRAYLAEGEFVPGSPSQSYYYGPDQLGSARRVYASGQAPTYDYDPYGNPLQSTARLTDFNYAGTFYNADSGLNLTTYRAYDAAAGRFLSRDPTGEAADANGNLYAYVGGDPIGDIDPYGLFRWPDYIAANVNVAIPTPWTATLLGWSGTVSVDKYGDVFCSPLGGGFGKSATAVSGSLTANWLNCFGEPSPTQLANFLSASGFSGTAGFGLGGNESYTPGSGWATGVGLVSPQAGVTYNYSFKAGNIGHKW